MFANTAAATSDKLILPTVPCTLAAFSSPELPHLSIASNHFLSDISTFLEYITWGIWVLNRLFPNGTKRLCPIIEFLAFGRLSIVVVVVDDDDDDEVDIFTWKLPFLTLLNYTYRPLSVFSNINILLKYMCK